MWEFHQACEADTDGGGGAHDGATGDAGDHGHGDAVAADGTAPAATPAADGGKGDSTAAAMADDGPLVAAWEKYYWVQYNAYYAYYWQSIDAAHGTLMYLDNSDKVCDQYAAFGFAGQPEQILATGGGGGEGAAGGGEGAAGGGSTVTFAGLHVNVVPEVEGGEGASMEMVLPQDQPPATTAEAAAAVAVAATAATSDVVTTGGREDEDMAEDGCLSAAFMARIAKYVGGCTRRLIDSPAY